MKDILTTTELQFLSRQGLSPEDVFDARGLPQWLWFQRIDQTDKAVALGTRCRKAGHRLRSRRGHCVQCDVRKLAFQARYKADQYVYIAGSHSEKLIKIGTCVDCSQRENQLRAERYGGAQDWRIVFAVKVREAGKIEGQAQLYLSSYGVARPYFKDGVEQYATELLACPFSKAMETLKRFAEGAELGREWMSTSCSDYDFST